MDLFTHYSHVEQLGFNQQYWDCTLNIDVGPHPKGKIIPLIIMSRDGLITKLEFCDEDNYTIGTYIVKTVIEDISESEHTKNTENSTEVDSSSEATENIPLLLSISKE